MSFQVWTTIHRHLNLCLLSTSKKDWHRPKTGSQNPNEVSNWMAFGSRWLTLTHRMKVELMCWKWQQTAQGGMHKCCGCSLNATREETPVDSIAYKDPITADRNKSSHLHAIVFIYPQAWTSMAAYARQEKVVVSCSVWFLCQPSVNGPCLVLEGFRPSIPISVYVSAGELYKWPITASHSDCEGWFLYRH